MQRENLSNCFVEITQIGHSKSQKKFTAKCVFKIHF